MLQQHDEDPNPDENMTENRVGQAPRPLARGWLWPKRLAAVLGVFVVLTGVAAGGWAIFIQYTGNLHVVEAGGAYRSNTLGPAQLEQVMADENIRTIINLRGGSENDAWYAAERRAAAAHGVDFIDVALSADEIPSKALMMQLINALETAPRPLLIHCNHGADRTSLAAALYEYLVAGKSASEASQQLSFYYGHFPWFPSRTGAMDAAFWEVVHENPRPPA